MCDSVQTGAGEAHSGRYGPVDGALKHLEGKSLAASCGSKPLGECGPFLQRLIDAADEERFTCILDDIYNRLFLIFAPCLEAAAAAAKDDVSEVDAVGDACALAEDSASRAFNLVVAEAFPSLASSSECLCLPRRAEAASWRRFGELTVRLVRGAADDDSQSSAARLRWAGADGDTPPMLSAFVIIWGEVVRLLRRLVEAVGVVESDGGSSDTTETHPLLLVVSDCVVAMVECNDALQRQKGGASAPAEVLRTSVNNCMWIKQQCCRLPMSNAHEVRLLVDGYAASALQDLLSGCAAELQYVISSTTSVAEDGEGQPAMLADRIASLCRLIRGVAPPIPRVETASLLLERTLRPVVERLLDGNKQRGVTGLGVITRTLRAFGDVQRVAGGSFLQDLAGKVTGKRGGHAAANGDDRKNTATVSEPSIAHRLSEVLRLLAEDPVFGPECCQRSPSFCTLRRLVSDPPP